MGSSRYPGSQVISAIGKPGLVTRWLQGVTNAMTVREGWRAEVLAENMRPTLRQDSRCRRRSTRAMIAPSSREGFGAEVKKWSARFQMSAPRRAHGACAASVGGNRPATPTRADGRHPASVPGGWVAAGR